MEHYLCRSVGLSGLVRSCADYRRVTSGLICSCIASFLFSPNFRFSVLKTWVFALDFRKLRFCKPCRVEKLMRCDAENWYCADYRLVNPACNDTRRFLKMSSFLRSLSRRFSIKASSSSSPSTTNLLTEQNQSVEEIPPKNNIFEEEVCFEDINQAIDNWEIPKIPQDELYIPDESKHVRSSDYIIRTAENNIPLDPQAGEEFHLLTKQSIAEHSRKYKYLHIGCVQVAVKPLVREGLNASILMCLRDIRHNDFHDSLIGTVETSLGHGPVYFNCFPNKTLFSIESNTRS
ncbi:hypothetical protein VNO78_00875 [Psophocarpus tetragonolobus]|uniref:Uncharacterized protein n=1 Tax=Psophocarpus tetragonolobus TaxID=3891 RepID=A0AAN9SYX0_PSOTE